MKKKSNIVEIIAKQEGVSVEECRREMEIAISYARNNPDLEKRKRFCEIFGERTPTPEEFIMTVAKIIK